MKFLELFLLYFFLQWAQHFSNWFQTAFFFKDLFKYLMWKMLYFIWLVGMQVTPSMPLGGRDWVLHHLKGRWRFLWFLQQGYNSATQFHQGKCNLLNFPGVLEQFSWVSGFTAGRCILIPVLLRQNFGGINLAAKLDFSACCCPYSWFLTHSDHNETFPAPPECGTCRNYLWGNSG